MLSFKDFILEYLTDKQRERYSDVKMTPMARKGTDQYFGKDNDHVREEIPNYDHDKSEVHRAVERHLGKDISHEEYRSGLTSDKYGRQTKIGKMIKDESLKNQFASDTTREGSKSLNKPYATIVRGTEVAGQTNSATDPNHPKGHSWGDLSCKNVDDGFSKRYLEHEIKHGTVVYRAHDGNGQEIYRATLHPHDNTDRGVLYAMESEYGIKHPAFTKHAHEVAKKLTTSPFKPHDMIYTKNPHVYNDNGRDMIPHPEATPDHILKHSDRIIRRLAFEHPDHNVSHVDAGMKDPDTYVKVGALLSPHANASHVTAAMKNSSPYVRRVAIQSPHHNASHIDAAIGDTNSTVAEVVLNSPHHNVSHVDVGMKHSGPYVRRAALESPHHNVSHVDAAMGDSEAMVRHAALKSPHANQAHFKIGLEDSNEKVRALATSRIIADKKSA